ncbi:hypothetical protein KJ766_03385 [Patescibacteria group bacterium]|nr:hypothetical protein [Patescibacteria group bacterium]
MRFNLYIGEVEIPESACERLLGMAMVRLRCEVDTELVILKEGVILFWVHKERKYRVYGDVQRALRACEHIGAGYGWGEMILPGELEQLRRFAAQHMNMCYLLMDWHGMSERQRELYTDTCRSIVRELHCVRDEDKKHQAEWTAMASSIRDSLGRNNPSRTMALHTAARFAAMSREHRVMAIAERIDYRKVALVREVTGNVNLRRELQERLRLMLEALDAGQRSLSYFRSMVASVTRDTVHVHDRPWRHVFAHTREDLTHGIAAANAGDWQELRRRMRVCHVALELYDERVRLAEFQIRVARARRARGEPRRAAISKLGADLDALIACTVVSSELRNDPRYKRYSTRLMSRYRGYLRNARKAWRRGDVSEMVAYLREAESVF